MPPEKYIEGQELVLTAPVIGHDRSQKHIYFVDVEIGHKVKFLSHEDEGFMMVESPSRDEVWQIPVECVAPVASEIVRHLQDMEFNRRGLDYSAAVGETARAFNVARDVVNRTVLENMTFEQKLFLTEAREIESENDDELLSAALLKAYDAGKITEADIELAGYKEITEVRCI